MTAWQLTAFLLCVTLAASTQAITGFALSLILLGLTGLFRLAPLTDVANVATVLSLASGATALHASRKGLDLRILRATLAGSVPGVPAGLLLLAWLSANAVLGLRLLLGLVVLACAIIVLLRPQPLPRISSGASFGGYGFVSGLLGGLFSASGPPLVYQMYRQPLPVDAVRDTLVACLCVGAGLRLAMVVGSGGFGSLSLQLCLLAVPWAMAVTWWVRRHPPAWPRETVLKIVCGLLAITSLGLMGPAVHGLAAKL